MTWVSRRLLAVGYARMHALAGELRRLRAHIGRPLADLTAEAERVLGLDIEVAARPGADPVAARADLDAFTDVAAAFTGEGAEPTLGAFLAYLAAAQQEEFGLETGRVGKPDSVELLTVHAAKGLSGRPVRARPGDGGAVPGVPGPAPGLHAVDGQRPADPVQPARRRGGPARASWLDAVVTRRLHRGLRGAGPGRGAGWDVRGDDPGGVLAGVFGLLVGRGRTSRLGPSPFLEEVREPPARRGRSRPGRPRPTRRGEPAAGHVETADWPATRPARSGGPPGRRLVEAALARAPDAPRTSPLFSPGGPIPPAELDRAVPDLARRTGRWWRRGSRDADLLLAERGPAPGRRRDPGGAARRLSVSSPGVARPRPGRARPAGAQAHARPPARQARRGTAFHRWLEQRYGQQMLIDDSDLFGPTTTTGETAGRGDLAELRARFERGSGPIAGRGGRGAVRDAGR